MRNIHSRFFYLLYEGLRLGFGLGFDWEIVLELAFEFGLDLSKTS